MLLLSSCSFYGTQAGHVRARAGGLRDVSHTSFAESLSLEHFSEVSTHVECCRCPRRKSGGESSLKCLHNFVVKKAIALGCSIADLWVKPVNTSPRSQPICAYRRGARGTDLPRRARQIECGSNVDIIEIVENVRAYFFDF